MKKYMFIILGIFSIGCVQKNNQHHENTSVKLTKIQELVLDTIQLDHVVSSYNGDIHIEGDSIYFIDYRFGWVFIFDIEGNYVSRKLGQGRGPKEIPTKSITSFCFLSNENKIFIGSSLDGYLYNKKWDLINNIVIDRTGINNYNSEELGPQNPFTYTLDYDRLFVRHDPENKYLYLPIYAEQKNFNPFVKDYYKKSHILEKVRISDGKVVDLLGVRSPEYLKYNYVGQYSFFSFDIPEDKLIFFVTHEIDSLIYIYDNKFRLINTFGYAGKDMNTKYTEVDHMDPVVFQRLYFVERPKHGYYSHLEYIDATALLFRSYKKSDSALNDGLQIYQHNELLGDVDVPKDFIVKGYEAPYYYSGAYIDEENETIKICRFKIELSN